MQGLKLVPFLAFSWILSTLLCIECSGTAKDKFIEVDGILVRETDLIQDQCERIKVEERENHKARIEEEEVILYNESQEWTKNLPNKCQGRNHFGIICQNGWESKYKINFHEIQA